MTPQKIEILKNAVFLAERLGYRNITREGIAKKSGVAAGTVSYHFKTMARLRDAVIAEAIEQQSLPILGQALADKHRKVLQIDPELRKKAAKAIAA